MDPCLWPMKSPFLIVRLSSNRAESVENTHVKKYPHFYALWFAATLNTITATPSGAVLSPGCRSRSGIKIDFQNIYKSLLRAWIRAGVQTSTGPDLRELFPLVHFVRGSWLKSEP